MKKIISLLIATTLTACAANPAVYKSTSQNYRAAGNDKTVKLDASIAIKQNLLDKDYAVTFFVNENPALFFQLDKGGNGSLSCETLKGKKESPTLLYCEPFNGHKIGATCNGSTANGNLISSNCSFTFDNEIAANFKF